MALLGDITADSQADVFQFSGSGFDATRVDRPVVTLVGDTYYMLYSGLPFGNNYQIGLATSTDGVTWTRAANNPVINNATSPAWDSFREIPVAMMSSNGVLEAWFNGDHTNLGNDPGATEGFGFAISTDNGLTWSQGANPIRNGLNANGAGIDLVAMVKFNGQYLAYYVQHTQTGDVLYQAKSTDGIVFDGDAPATVIAGYSLEAATTVNYNGQQAIFSVWTASDGTRHWGLSTDGQAVTLEGAINLQTDSSISSIVISGEKLEFYGSIGVGNVNWPYGNQDVEYATAALPPGITSADQSLVVLPNSQLTGTVHEVRCARPWAIDSAGGYIAFQDANQSAPPTVQIVSASEAVIGHNSDGTTFSLTSAEIGTIENALSILPAQGSANSGQIPWAYNIRNRLLSFLAPGQSVELNAPVIVTDQTGSQVSETLRVLIDGGPIARSDSASVLAGGFVSATSAGGVLDNDFDPDAGTPLNVVAVNGRSCNVGESVRGEHGTLTLNGDGSYLYIERSHYIPWEGVHDVFAYTVSNGHGGFSTSHLSIDIAPGAVGDHSCGFGDGHRGHWSRCI